MYTLDRKAVTGLVLAVVLLLGTMGCSDLVDGYDEDPNSATDSPPELILTGAEVGLILLEEGQLARNAAVWTDHFTGSDRQYRAINIYNVISDDYTNMWNLAYVDVIAQTKLVRAAASETNNRLLRGIATVVEAQTFGTMTSLFGDIPFTQAAQPEEFPDPVFDAQAQVYAGVQQMLSDAIADLESGAGVSPGSSDFFFSGDTDKWLGVAHTLKARYYMHTGEYQNALQEAAQGIASPSAGLVAPHNGSYGNDMNAYYKFVAIDRSGYMTANGAFAPRLLDPASSDYRGNAKTDETARFDDYYVIVDGEYDLNTDGAFAAAADFPLVTYVENQLILAEARLLANNDLAGALDALNAARAAVDARYGPGAYAAYVASDFDAGGIANTQGESAANALLREVLTEKYLSLTGQIEPFNDARRTGNFIGIPIKFGNQFPQRFLYAQSEVNANDNAPSPVPGVFDPTSVNASLSYTGMP